MRTHTIRTNQIAAGRYAVTGAGVSILSTSAPVRDAALALRDAGHPESDLIAVASGEVTILPVSIGSISVRAPRRRSSIPNCKFGLDNPSAEHSARPKPPHCGTKLGTKSDMATFRMLPPINVTQQTITANGRLYSGAPGTAQDVPDMDAGVLAANGWVKVSISGPTSARPSTNPNVSAPYTAARGVIFYDTTLSEVVIFEGATWRTPAGASA
jgi:hypothetical protein